MGMKTMTKWIRLHNDGEFDVVTAIGMLGASVKNCDDPIGLYGSGIKYAMAQALRMGISMKISDKGQLYTLSAVESEFRGETFKNVSLKTKTGKIHKTGITTDFGKEDWNDEWFIFREFYSNMLDEGGTLEIVNGVQPSDSGVDVFLPYAEFKEIVDNLDDYFCPKDFKIKPGTGRVFKKGVWVGNLRKNPGLDFQNNTVEITETRTLNHYSAWRCLESCIERDGNQEVLVELFKNPECWMEMSNLWLHGEPCNLHVHDALVEVFGSNYIICPDVDWIIKDAEEVYGRNPVLLPKDWNLPQDKIQTMDDLSQNIIFRDATPLEQTVIDKGIKALTWMNDVRRQDGLRYKLKIEDMNVRVLKTTENCGGLAKKGTPEIAINADVITGDFTRFVETLMHESIHAISGEGDYTRGFAGYMERALAQLST
jgi:hypothetical protein